MCCNILELDSRKKEEKKRAKKKKGKKHRKTKLYFKILYQRIANTFFHNDKHLGGFLYKTNIMISVM